MNCVLILSHGNADPERGFSVNEHLLNIHGSFTNEETINRKGGVESIKVSKDLIKVCQNAYSLYRQELAEKRKQELEAKEAAIRV